MGTNYYVSGPDIAELVGAETAGLHIGKKSAGWDFLFRAHPLLQLDSVARWREFVAGAGRAIVSEYHEVQDVNAFFDMATRRPVDDPTLHAHNRTLSKTATGYTYDPAARGVPFLACEFC